MTISIIFTGGTIGSLTKKEWVGIDDSAKYMLLNRFDNKAKGVEFQISAPYSVLSENLSANELNILQAEIKSELAKKPDGIIVTHGTDSLQYTAAALEYAFADTPVPIVLVSADYPLDNEKTNGYINFEAAVEFIINTKLKGVFVSYKNSDSDIANIHIASRILQHAEGSAEIYGIGQSVCATYEGKITMLDTELSVNAKGIGVVEYSENSHILSVESVPGNSYNYSLDEIKAIILKPYHSATLNTQSEGLSKLCEKAYDSNIPVFVCGVKSGIGYESTKLFTKLNINAAPYSSFISLYMKIWVAVSRGLDIEKFVDTAIANELV